MCYVMSMYVYKCAQVDLYEPLHDQVFYNSVCMWVSVGVVLWVTSWAKFLQMCVSVAVIVSIYERFVVHVVVIMHAARMSEAEST